MENTKSDLVVRPEDPDANEMTKFLGISEERAFELMKKLQHLKIDHRSFGMIGAEISKECTHANELFYVSTMLGIKIEEANRRSGFEEFIKSIKQSGEQD